MKINLQQKLRGSLFLKILVVFLLAYISITVFSLTTHQMFIRRVHISHFLKSKVHYSHYLVKDFGFPPDTVRVKKMADSMDIKIRFANKDLNWASQAGILPFNKVAVPDYEGDSGIRAGFQHGVGLLVDMNRQDGHYLLILKSEHQAFNAAATLSDVLNVAFTTLVIIGIYFALRWLLRPISVLHDGVEQLQSGNLDYQVKSNRSDELGELVNSFNAMTGRIKEMIHSKEQLLLDVSHELRSPLTRVKVALEFLDDGSAKQNIYEDTAEMESMITEILESQRLNSKYGSLNLKSVNITGLIHESVANFKNQKPGIKLSVSTPVVFLNADPDRVRILFKNVLSNAIKYSDPNGKAVDVSLMEKSEEVCIMIRDFGSGIPEKDVPFVFEPFYRVDKSRSKETGGYGLGLSLCKKIMQAHGGCIELNSKLNHGTVMTLKFKKPVWRPDFTKK